MGEVALEEAHPSLAYRDVGRQTLACNWMGQRRRIRGSDGSPEYAMNMAQYVVARRVRVGYESDE